jgi:TPR repeat protein
MCEGAIMSDKSASAFHCGGAYRAAALAVCTFLLLHGGVLYAADADTKDNTALEAGKSALNQKDYPRAFASFRPLAEAGDSEAQRAMGLIFRNGWGVTKDEATATSWFRKAAEGGSAPAESEMGQIYLLGIGIAADSAMANEWFRKAAEAGDARGQGQLGYSYLAGRGIAKDPYAGLNWLTRAGAQGNAAALRNIGEAYLAGNGLEKSEDKAVFWLAAALQRADPRQHDVWYPRFRALMARLSTVDAIKHIADAAKWSPTSDGLGPVIADAMAFRDGVPAQQDGQTPAAKNGI